MFECLVVFVLGMVVQHLYGKKILKTLQGLVAKGLNEDK